MMKPTCNFELEEKRAAQMTVLELQYAINDAAQALQVCPAECEGKYFDQISVYRRELMKRKS